MADNLTLRLKAALEERHGRAVSEDEVASFLRSEGLLGTSSPTQSPSIGGAPRRRTIEDIQRYESDLEESQETKAGLLNAVGAGLWTFTDVATYGVAGVATRAVDKALGGTGEGFEQYLEMEAPSAKWSAAVGGLVGFVKGAPMKVGGKLVQQLAKPFIRGAGYKPVGDITKEMLKRAKVEGVSKSTAKDIVGHYRGLVSKAQHDPNFAKTFGEKATKILVKYTDDAEALGQITAAEKVAIKRMFGDNYMKRPLQDFVGLMATRGIAKTNPRLAKMTGHLINDALMFGMIDTIFEGVTVVEDHEYDYTAPLWGVATGGVFAQLQWLKPVGKGSKWFLDFKAGVRSAFSRKPPYENYTKKQLEGAARFFGEALESVEGGSHVVKISHQGKDKTIGLLSENIFRQLEGKFGKEEGRNALVKYLESQRKVFGKDIIKAATGEGFRNLQQNWMRMAAGGLAFNFHTFADMVLHGTEPDIHDILPHFLIGAFLQIGRNPSRFDLNSTKMNRLRQNLVSLGVKTKQLPREIPSFQNVPSRFANGVTPTKHKKTMELYEQMGLGNNTYEATDTQLAQGEVSVETQGNAKFERIRDQMRGHFKHQRPRDDISVKEAEEVVRQFEKETGLKTLEEYDRHFDEASLESTRQFKREFPDLLEKIRIGDEAGELGIKIDEKGRYQTPEGIIASEEILQLAREGKLDWILDADGNKIESGILAEQKLMNKLDGYANITMVGEVLQNVKRMPAGKETMTVRNVDTMRSIYEAIVSAETRINDAFPSRMSYSDSFTFKTAAPDYIKAIGKSISIESSSMIGKIFSKDFGDVPRAELISHMKNSGLLLGVGVAKPEIRGDTGTIDIKFPDGTPEAFESKRGPELKRALRRIHMLQSISGGYEKSQSKDRIEVKSEQVESLLNFLKDSGMERIDQMKEWIFQDTMNYIIRDKIRNAPNLQVAEMNAFFNISEVGMANFNLDLKAGQQGFEIFMIDEAFVPNGQQSMAVEYNNFALDIIQKSNGLIKPAGKKKVVSRDEMLNLRSLLPDYDGPNAQAPAQSVLLELVNELPKGSGIANTLGQYVIEGGSTDVVRWLTQHGVLEYSKKSSTGWNVNMKKFTEKLESQLMNKMEHKGFTPDYVDTVIAREEQIARAAMNEGYMPDIDHRFDANKFLEKYNIDNIDYSVESKEQKRKITEELILSENTPIEDRVPAADIASNVLKRISVKNNKGEWVEYKNIEKSQQKYVKEEIIGDLVKIIASQYNSIKVNSFKYENSSVFEKEVFQQKTRLHTMLGELNLPYAIIETEAIVYEHYYGKFQRRFLDIFGDSSDLPNRERESIIKHREDLGRHIGFRSSSFGSQHQDGMVIFQISKDTAPIAIAREHLTKKVDLDGKPVSNIQDAYSVFAEWALANKNISENTKRTILAVNNKIKDPELNGKPTDFDHQFMLTQLVFNDMLKGEKSSKKLEDFLNDVDVDKTMGRIKLYDSKNFVKHDRNLVHSMMTLYRESLGDNKTYNALAKVFKQDGFNVAIWNDVDYANVKRETEKILKENGWSEKQISDYFNNVIGNAHERVSSFDSIAFVSRGTIRYAHAMMGNNPNSTNPIKPAISSGGRSGQLLMGKTLLVYSEALDPFFKTNTNVDVLLASSGAKAFNEGILREGKDITLINQPYNRINTTRAIGAQKIRKIPIDALGFKPEADVAVKDAKESVSDFNYARQEELEALYREGYEQDVGLAIKAMKTLSADPIRIRRFILDTLGQEGMGLDPSTGGAQHLSNIVRYASMHVDANPMSYSDRIVKNKMYNTFINAILNGKRSSFKVSSNLDGRYGGQAPLIQVPDAAYRLRPTIVGVDGKMKMRGEIMIGEHERLSSVSDIIKSGREMIFVDGAKTISPKKFFGKTKEGKDLWDEILVEGLSLGDLYDIIEAGKTGFKPYSKDLQIGILTNRKPHTRPNDMAILGLKGFLPGSYGRSALVNSLDVVNIFEGDYDADKVDYFYGARKSMYDHAKRASDFYVQGIDPDNLKRPSTFSWSDDPTTIVGKIVDMAASSSLAKKSIGVVQKVPRMLGNLDAIAMSGEGDPALKLRFGAEKRIPKILFFTPAPKGEQYRITIDFDNMDYYTRAALETQYMLDMGGGVNTELMRDVRDWKDKFLFPPIDESITPNKAQRDGPGFINQNIINNNVSKRLRIFRKFDRNGDEQVLTSLEKDMIKTMMRQYGKFLNVAGPKTFKETSEKRATSYDDVYTAADDFFNFHSNLSESLYYKLQFKKDASGVPYWKDSKFQEMFEPKREKYGPPDKKTKKRKYRWIPGKNMFDDAGEQIKQNSQKIHDGERGSILERSLRPMWEADVFDNKGMKKLENFDSVSGDMIRYMDSWYQQLRTGEVSEYSGSIDMMQSNIMKTVSDYNSGAYYIGKLKSQVMKTKNRKDISYTVQKKIIEKLNETIKSVEDKIKELVPQKYWDTKKSKDLTKFYFTPVAGREAKEGVIQYNTIESIIEGHQLQGLGTNGRAYLQEIKDVTKMFYGNFNSLKDVLSHGKQSVLDRPSLDFLKNMPTMSSFEEVRHEMLAIGVTKYKMPFILEYMRSPKDDFNIGIHNGQLVSMPYGKSTRYSRGLKFLTRLINEKKADDGRIQFDSSDVKVMRELLRIIQTTEANFERFYNKKFDMRNFGDPNYSVNIGTKDNPIMFSLDNIRLPSFGRDLNRVLGDFNTIRWTRDTNRISSGFETMNDNMLSFYTDIMKIAGKTEEFKDYLDIMHGLKADMISNRIIDPILYLATRNTIEKDVKRVVNEVLTGGLMDNKQDADVRRLMNNPVYIINGGTNFFKGVSLEPKMQYDLKKLREIVQTKKELSEAQHKLGWKTEKAEETMREFKENCRIK